MKEKRKSDLIGAIASSLIMFLFIALIFLQFKTVDETKEANIEDLRDTELQAQIAQYKERYEDANSQYLNNMNLINEYNNPTSNEDSASTNTLNSEYKQSLKLLGLTDVQGQGIIITLTDTETGTYRSEDLRSLVNELKYAGAEAISINNNRIVNLTDIVTLNDSFIVLYGGSVRITSPYVVKAIGDRKYLSSTLNTKSSGFVDLMKSNELEIKVEEVEKVEIKKYEKAYSTGYMSEVDD